MRQGAAVHSCIIISIIIYHAHVSHVIVKIRFQLGKLGQKLESEDEKSRFQAQEIDDFRRF